MLGVCREQNCLLGAHILSLTAKYLGTQYVGIVLRTVEQERRMREECTFK